jgi:hypothetical protein
LGCLNNCVDDACANDCFNQYPGGINQYQVVGECVFCSQCLSTCGAC